MSSTPWYSKSKPKVSDYNPLTHSAFYSQGNRTTFPANSYSPPKPIRDAINSTQPLGKAASLRHLSNRSPFADSAVQQLGGQLRQADRFYKTRPRNFFTDPITGTTKQFEIGAREIESFDTRATRDRMPRVKSTEPTLAMQTLPKERISGALRKEVPNVGYVNPYLLKATMNSSAVLRKTFETRNF